jgi:hypothetical protein
MILPKIFKKEKPKIDIQEIIDLKKYFSDRKKLLKGQSKNTLINMILNLELFVIKSQNKI